MEPIETAILRTLIYADVFRFALTFDELHRYLITSHPVTFDEIQTTLHTSSWLQRSVYREQCYICLAEHPEYVQERIRREAVTQDLWQEAVRYGRWLAALPFVRMVAMTGALSVRNPASHDDDFDYMLITQPRRVWLARAFAILLVRVVRWHGRELCPNYVVAANNMGQRRRDIFIAHEVAQMVPITGGDLYQQFWQENRWLGQYLPNAHCQPTPAHQRHWLTALLEWVLGGLLGDWLETWEYRRKQRKFAPQMQQALADATIDAQEVKGHFDDNGYFVLRAYHQRLQKYGLSTETLTTRDGSYL